MKPRLRKRPPTGAPPIFEYACKLCEASYPSKQEYIDHVNWAHGGMARYGAAWVTLESYQPHVTSPQEHRAVIEGFAFCYEHGVTQREQFLPPEPYKRDLDVRMWLALYSALHDALQRRLAAAPDDLRSAMNACHRKRADLAAWQEQHTCCSSGSATDAGEPCTHPPPPPPRRRFQGCAFCAIQHWPEEQVEVYLATPEMPHHGGRSPSPARCFMPSPGAVAALRG